ncbi:MAG: site-specific integrase [Muribaculaceae bacterium]|nr:site-specific integrase [Muribaculaceae bacterium]
MATIKVKFRPSTVADPEGTGYYQIMHERKVKALLSECQVFPSEWDEKRSLVVIDRHRNERRHIVKSVRECIRRDVDRLTRIIGRLDRAGIVYTPEDVIDEFERYADQYTLFNFMQNIIIRLRQNGKTRTAETYTATLNSFRKFLDTYDTGQPSRLPNNDLMLDALNSDVLEAYQAWHQNRGVAPNTISFYIRILRAVYNRAVEDEIIENHNPFRHVYTGVDKTVKRALPLAIIKKIKRLDLSNSPTLDYARDMFMLSFMLRGMSFIDMAFLRKIDLAEGYIIYRRRKTGQQLTIEWTRDMQHLLDKYPENITPYLLPIIRRPDADERSTYRNTAYNINHSLKKIAPMVGITVPLTLYVARPSWASVAKAQGIPISVISEGMGHDSETTTRIYLASLDTSVVDRANSLILKALK